MNVEVTHRDNCRLCESRDVRLVVKLNPVPLAEKYTLTSEEAKNAARFPIDLYMCSDCSHVQLLDVINSAQLWKDYTYHSGQTRGIVNHFQDVSKKIMEQYQPPKGSLVVDIGSNDGTLLRFFKDAGYQVHGVDPAVQIAEKATASGIPTSASLFNQKVVDHIVNKHGQAHVVTAFNVYAHADNLGAMTDSIHNLLHPNGIFVFEVQYLMDIVDKVLVGTIFHEHMSHHSLIPMQKFLNLHQMELIHVERVSIQKGSIIGFAQPIGGLHPVLPSVSELLSLEKEKGLNTVQVMENFNTRLEKNRNMALELIASWREKKYIIAGYGAARSGPTLTAQFGFDNVIEYIFDDHPQKVNRYSPGSGVPVLPTSDLLIKKPDIVVILAWIHARTIIEKSQQYLEAGGKFVICTPDVRVIDKNNPL